MPAQHQAVARSPGPDVRDAHAEDLGQHVRAAPGGKGHLQDLPAPALTVHATVAPKIPLDLGQHSEDFVGRRVHSNRSGSHLLPHRTTDQVADGSSIVISTCIRGSLSAERIEGANDPA